MQALTQKWEKVGSSLEEVATVKTSRAQCASMELEKNLD